MIRQRHRPTGGACRVNLDGPVVLKQILQERNQRLIGRRHGIIAQSLRLHPFQRLSFPPMRDAFITTAHVKRHQQVKGLVGVAGEGQRRKAGNLGPDAQFLVQFTDKGLFRRFTVLHLAAGKLPQAGERLALGPLRQKNAAILIEKRAGSDQQNLLPASLILQHPCASSGNDKPR